MATFCKCGENWSFGFSRLSWHMELSSFFVQQYTPVCGKVFLISWYLVGSMSDQAGGHESIWLNIVNLEQGKRVFAAWCRRSIRSGRLWLLDTRRGKICLRFAFYQPLRIPLTFGVGGGSIRMSWSQVERFWNSAAEKILGVPTCTPFFALILWRFRLVPF